MSDPENEIIVAAPFGGFLPSGRGLSRMSREVESVEVDDLGCGDRRLGVRLEGRRPVEIFLDRAAARHLAGLLIAEEPLHHEGATA